MRQTSTIRRLGTAAVIAALLTGCYPQTYHEIVFQNDSSYDIWVYKTYYDWDGVDTTISNTMDSVFVKSGSEKPLLVESGETLTLSDFDTCLRTVFSPMFLLSAIVADNDAMEIHVDLNDPNNWVNTVLEERREGTGRCECRLTVDDTQVH